MLRPSRTPGKAVDLLVTCLLPALWLVGLTVLMMQNQTGMKMLAAVCTFGFIFSSLGASTLLLRGRTRKPSLITTLGIYAAGLWIVPYLVVPITELLEYPLMMPAAVLMLVPILVHWYKPLSLGPFLILVSLCGVLVYSSVRITDPHPVDTTLLAIAAALSALPGWCLVVYSKLVGRVSKQRRGSLKAT